MVSLPAPFSVTTQEFSMPTGPTPGNTILGSRANTIPSSNSLRIRGANTGASLISNPMPCPIKRHDLNGRIIKILAHHTRRRHRGNLILHFKTDLMSCISLII